MQGSHIYLKECPEIYGILIIKQAFRCKKRIMGGKKAPEKSIFSFKACRLFLQRLCREPAVN